ncbi:SMI1/KNR4 family protein [Listeria rocourtiae]|uniref:SMI1/KNR4 family protein n=1 Tax=Listeria rocourtiae TaxID=647910 RepID=UPI00162802AA|nr:SMI1/KNR4 family protein [Listeria rocourtiae]MBC1606021.1 SMI1/KNR4 family protein [Listeria rocourtiae]
MNPFHNAYEFLALHLNNEFYNVPNEAIEQAQADLGFKFPQELIDCYTHLGYGFIKGSRQNVNRLMDPLSVRDFRLKQNDFEFFPDIELYDNLEDELIFFEANETAIISIKLVDSESSAIYYDEFKIANSLAEFLQKIAVDDMYYMDLID